MGCSQNHHSMKKRIFELLGAILFVIGIAAIWGLGSSCRRSNPTPPTGVRGSFGTNQSAYACTPIGSPLDIIKRNRNGGGSLTIGVTSNRSPAFVDNRVYTRFSSEISCPVGSSNCCADILVPNRDGYRVTLFFNEAGSGACSPGSGLCYRWCRQESFPSRFVPRCSNRISINMISPRGFVGPCP